jgi:hypothetical protein
MTAIVREEFRAGRYSHPFRYVKAQTGRDYTTSVLRYMVSLLVLGGSPGRLHNSSGVPPGR